MMEMESGRSKVGPPLLELAEAEFPPIHAFATQRHSSTPTLLPSLYLNPTTTTTRHGAVRCSPGTMLLLRLGLGPDHAPAARVDMHRVRVLERA